MDTENIITITQVQFQNFKAFRNFSVNIREVNILVGPNNSGKSTILNAFRVLAVGIRRANSKIAIVVPGPDGNVYGHYVPVEELPISFENVHNNYDTQRTSTITFIFSNKNRLVLFFSKSHECILIPIPVSRSARTPSTFKKEFPISVDFVPVLGPLEHNEPRVEDRTVSRNLPTHRASRNFRNYWRYYPDEFNEFARLLSDTWPNMSILPPEMAGLDTVVMFCNEDGILRELYWAGFGFQVWCQLLTHIVRTRKSDFLVLDEPEIYLHPDLQRQLISLLRNAGPRILLATHSTEVIAEADPDEILVVDKLNRSAKRLRDIDEVQKAVESLGSSQNFTLTQLARTRRVLFVEGTDFRLFAQFARILALSRVAKRGVVINQAALSKGLMRLPKGRPCSNW
jgi:AAA15 family ATPase/GTPase